MRSEKKLHNHQMMDSHAQDHESEVMEVDLLEFMYRLIEKIKWVILGAVIGMVVTGLFTRFVITPMYQSTTKLYVQEAKDKIVDLSAINLSDKLAADYIQVFNNWHVHDAVIKALDLPYTYTQMNQMLTVNAVSNTRIISITATSSDPKEAYNIARAYAAYAPIFIAEKMLTSSPTVFEEARIPTKPSSPNMILNLFLGTFLGIAAAVTIIFVQFVSDDRIRNAEMLQKRLGLATLGMMPVQEGGNTIYANINRNGKGGRA